MSCCPFCRSEKTAEAPSVADGVCVCLVCTGVWWAASLRPADGASNLARLREVGRAVRTLANERRDLPDLEFLAAQSAGLVLAFERDAR